MSTVKIPYFTMGSLVTVSIEVCGEPAGVVAFVYEHYGAQGGISLITQNGVDLGGWSLREQALYLNFYGDTKYLYLFKSVIQLAADWDAGVFKFIFDNLQKYKHDLKTRRRNN
jgi:hypothetical protein